MLRAVVLIVSAAAIKADVSCIETRFTIDTTNNAFSPADVTVRSRFVDNAFRPTPDYCSLQILPGQCVEFNIGAGHNVTATDDDDCTASASNVVARQLLIIQLLQIRIILCFRNSL